MAREDVKYSGMDGTVAELNYLSSQANWEMEVMWVDHHP